MTNTIASRIRKIREDAGDNPNEAARKVGISRTGYVKWEGGDTENMKIRNLLTFCDKYRTDVVYLLTGEGRGQNVVMQTAATYGTNIEAITIADAYDRLPVEKRLDIRLAIAKALLAEKIQNPLFDTGDLGQLIEIKR